MTKRSATEARKKRVTLRDDCVRPERLANAIMDAAPVNEMGVVCLFTEWARKRNMRIETIRAEFPDCIAWQRAGGEEKRLRIEFEFRSRNFRAHRHDPSACDWIVCWEHDWAACPERITVIELRKEYGLGFNVWLQPVGNDTKEQYSSSLADVPKHCSWTVASQAHEGDLVIFYHSTPRREIGDIFRIDSSVRVGRAPKGGFSWNARERDWKAQLVRVAQLASPVALAHLKAHPALKTAGWLRNNLVSRAKVTVDWIFLRELIVARNPTLERRLPTADGFMPSTLKKRG
jgi:predicted RNA-binding protein with PUA-like domain